MGAGLAAAAVAAVLPAIALAQTPAASRWTAALTGANEVPATTSTSTGTFTATLDEAAGTLTWTLTVPAITNATAAHLHAGAAGANGGIVLPLFAAPTNAPTANISVSGTSKASDLTGSLAGNFAGFVTALKANGIYANVHTTANAGGEIRAQVTVVPAAGAPAPTTATPAKTGNAGLVGATSHATGVEVGLLVLLAGAAVVAGRIATRGARN